MKVMNIMSALSRRARLLPAPVDEVWCTLAAFGGISTWAPNVDHSRSLGPFNGGVGAARRVQVGRLGLIETVTTWDPPCRLAYQVAGLPPQLGCVTYEWNLVSDQSQTKVTVITTVQAGRSLPHRLVAWLAVRRLAATSEQLLTGLSNHRSSTPEVTP